MHHRGQGACMYMYMHVDMVRDKEDPSSESELPVIVPTNTVYKINPTFISNSTPAPPSFFPLFPSLPGYLLPK